jgi:antirestriction protein ArdC
MAKAKKTKVNNYEKLTNQIIEKIVSSGKLPWQKPWKDDPNLTPSNIVSGNAYQGMNSLILDAGYASNLWMSYKQAKDLGGQVMKGEKGSYISYWELMQFRDKETDDIKKIPFLKLFTVFNLEQTEGVKVPKKLAIKPNVIKANQTAENIVKGYKDAPIINHGSTNQAHYNSQTDAVGMPRIDQFVSSDDYYSVLYHELSHSTGHAKRLDRKLGNGFGSHAYSKEELIADFSACFLCKEAGINTTVDNTTAYLKSWVSKLQDQPEMLIQASQQAMKATKHILGAEQ